MDNNLMINKNERLVFSAENQWNIRVRQELNNSQYPDYDYLNLAFDELLPELFRLLGLDRLEISNWQVLDELGIDSLEGPEYWDATALLTPCMLSGWLVNVSGSCASEPTLVEGDQLIDILKAANQAIVQYDQPAVVSAIHLNEQERTVLFLCS